MSSNRSFTARRGFTIVELMMVIGIIGILLGVVTTAASTSITQARKRKAAACCTIVEQALATYYAQKGEWPAPLGTKIANGSLNGDASDPDTYTLSVTDVNSMMREIIKEAKEGNPMMDISGLFVSRSSKEPELKDGVYRPAKGAYGLDFMDAIRGTKQSKKKMTTSEMTFGYPHADGGFMPFKVTYSIPADTMRVSQW